MTLKELYLSYCDCEKCELHKERNKVVFGKGPKNSKVMCIGEAPGLDEDITGKPFVGRPGKLLDKILNKVNLNKEDIFFTNVVCCRPTTISQHNGREEKKDRPPNDGEIDACKERLLETIRIVDPLVIVAFGATATATLLGKRKSKVRITTARGDMQDIMVPGVGDRSIKMAMLPTLHPAYLLRNPDTKAGGWIDMVKRDLERVTNILKEVRKWA